ncbi:hypothetical protein DPMN_004605 [Dreissena polymorpha]|uniref:Uncharacterized protein n=1 Tax=Dreissena polymorpha TaxID=45954 RepID=A0A9D4MNU2_DREPO|nr:hypothetical protein DPMN_004605 [Dreissena polymorpha]
MLDPFNQVPDSFANWEITMPESFTASGRPFTMRENRVGDITAPWGFRGQSWLPLVITPHRP